MTRPPTHSLTVGVLALQGAFSEHVQLLRHASKSLATANGPNLTIQWTFIEIRTPAELSKCDALIIPGGESTTISLVAERSGMLEPLRDFVKYCYYLLAAQTDVLTASLEFSGSQRGEPVRD